MAVPDPQATVGAVERPWRLQLVCCGRDDGVVTCETRADAELTRSAYISAEGHDRQAILTGPPGGIETDPMVLLGEYLSALGKGDWNETVCADIRALLEQVRVDCARMTAELEQVRGDWLTQAAQLNRIAGMVGHALILRACDDATSEEIRLALVRACEDVHSVINESEATRAQRTERYLVMCANLLNDHVIRERDALAERNEELRGALTVAVELIDRFARDGDCKLTREGLCWWHNGKPVTPCPHPLGRRFVEAWGPAQLTEDTEATS